MKWYLMNNKNNCNVSLKFKFFPSNYNILIVEDSRLINKTIQKEFTQKGFNCYAVSTLKEANEYLEKYNINYLMLDIHLPDGNGYELIKKLENNSEKIFVMTGEKDNQFRDISYQKGVIDFLTKDNTFFYKINQVFKTIEQLEKNKFKTILIIEDSLEIQKQLKSLFENRYYNIQLAIDQNSALEILNNKNIDLILLDTQLEDSSGIEFLQKNSNNIVNIKKIPVIMLCEDIVPSTIRDGLKAGAVDILKKPYIIEEIVLKVDLWIDYKIKEEEVICSNKILEEYKSAVDKSSIVSKADSRGIITYVNDRFCELSGFQKEELIGKNHNIVRHQDMPKEVFKDMWHTIKELKQPWKGKVKNRKKDNSFYWVDAFITPIINANGEIEEYIGLRYDITELETYKEILKNKLNDTSNSLKENLKYTAQYEDAINQFTVVLKTDTNNIITYANEELCKISGYSFEELLGLDSRDLRDKKHIVNDDSEVIIEKLSNKEIVSIQFTNISKDKQPYYVDTIIYPIVDGDENVKEHLYLMHDVTNMVNLHTEIENTQKDIVYKMGEIGESRSKETGNHVKRVAEYSKILAELYGLSQKDTDILFTASPMHDIGKVAIPDSILKKPGKLTDDEFNHMKEHTRIGYEVLKDSTREILQAAATVSYEHHEKWDGSGYPRGLKGEDIHIYGRITAVADVFDALGSTRCYKEKWEDERIYKLFEEERGKHFEPKLIDLFFENKDKFLEIRDRYKD